MFEKVIYRVPFHGLEDLAQPVSEDMLEGLPTEIIAYVGMLVCEDDDVCIYANMVGESGFERLVRLPKSLIEERINLSEVTGNVVKFTPRKISEAPPIEED